MDVSSNSNLYTLASQSCDSRADLDKSSVENPGANSTFAGSTLSFQEKENTFDVYNNTAIECGGMVCKIIEL